MTMAVDHPRTFRIQFCVLLLVHFESLNLCVYVYVKHVTCEYEVNLMSMCVFIFFFKS